MAQRPYKGPEFSREREIKVLLEDLRIQFRTFGEGLDDVRNSVGRVEERVDKLSGKVDNMAVDVEILKQDMAFVKRALQTVATKDDLLGHGKVPTGNIILGL